jgi:hypothetical protein
MNLTTLLAPLLAGALLAGGAFAQDQKPAAAAAEKPAAEAQAAERPKPGPGQEVDPKIIEGMVGCMAAGLPEDWKKAWFVVHQIGVNPDKSRKFEANFFFAKQEDDSKGEPLKTCGAEQVLQGVLELNAYLPDSQKRWSGVTMTFHRDGRYQANYDMTPFKPKPETKKASKTPPKKKAESSK